MPLNRSPRVAVLCLLLATAVATPAVAQPHGGHGSDGHARVAAERALTLDQAVAQAERRYKARAVRAEEKRRGDRIEYRIRLLGEDGRVFEVRVDAATGREG